jgi:hypothetical protein
MASVNEEVEPPPKRANTDRSEKEQCYVINPLVDSHYSDQKCISDIQQYRSKLTMFDYHRITQ